LKDAPLATPSVSIRQIKAARSLLGWPQSELAAAAGISGQTIRRLETRALLVVGRAEGARIVAAFQSAGVEFISENGDGCDVRLKSGREPETIPLEDLNASNDD
jgi:transcriptional regulator with XRE-family HTH domain